MSLYRGPSTIGESADNTVAMVLSAISSATNAANAANAANASKVAAETAKNDAEVFKVAAGASKDTVLATAIEVQGNANTVAASAAAFGIVQSASLYPYVPSKLRTVDLTTGTYQRAITSVATPDTRYDIAISSSNLVIDIRQVAYLIAGVRLNSISRVPGRAYTVQGSFDAGGTAITSNSGIGLAFDPGTSAGTNMVWDAAVSGWFWRQNGSITAYQALPVGASTVDAALAFSLSSGVVSAFAAGDVLKLELLESTTGAASTLKGYKNGTLQFTGTVLTVPLGRLAPVVRGAGSGGAYPLAHRFTFTEVSIQDRAVPEPAVAGASITVSTSPVAVAMESADRLQALLKLKSVFAVQADYNGQLKRVAPSGFEWLPVLPSAVMPGMVTTDKSLLLAFLQAYPAVLAGTIAYVETFGNNTSAAVGNSAKPYLTLDAALQSSARIILVGDGTFAPPDYRFTQAASGVMKLIVAKNRGKVTLRNAGDTLSANTWTAAAGYAGVYETPIASAAGGGIWESSRPHRIRLTDTVDSEGSPARLRWYKPATNDAVGVTAALVALQAAGTGWTYDGTTKKLYVALGGANVNAVKARLEALYYSALGSDRVYLAGGNLAFDGVDLDGQLIWMQEYNSSGTYIPASVWISNSRMVNASSYGVQGDSNTLAILENVHIHASEADGINPDSTRNGSGAPAKALLINPRITDCGDVDTFGTGVTQNRQAISSHAGYFAAYGGAYEHNWGQEIADTGSGAGPSKSWYVGASARNGDAWLAPNNVGFGFYDANRQAWLDTCVCSGEGANPLRIEGGASVKTFNCQFDGPVVAVAPSVAPVTYTPDAP